MYNFSKVFREIAVNTMCIANKWSNNIMALGGVNGPSGAQGPQEKPQVQEKAKKDNTAEINQQIQQYFNNAANMDTQNNAIDTKQESNFFDNAINNLRNKYPGASGVIDKLVNTITGGKKAEGAQPSGTKEDVNAATNSPVKSEEPTKFDSKGNVIPEVTHNSDGSTTIKHGGETIQGTDTSVSVTGKDGKPVGGTKLLPNGMQVLTQPDGKQGVFDPKKGEFLPDAEAQKVLTQFG